MIKAPDDRVDYPRYPYFKVVPTVGLRPLGEIPREMDSKDTLLGKSRLMVTRLLGGKS